MTKVHLRAHRGILLNMIKTELISAADQVRPEKEKIAPTNVVEQQQMTTPVMGIYSLTSLFNILWRRIIKDPVSQIEGMSEFAVLL